MVYRCQTCGRDWDEAAASENDYLCTRRCAGRLVAVSSDHDPGSDPHLLTRLPSMVAIPVQEYLLETHAAMRLLRLCEAAELVTKFLAIAALAELRRHDSRGALPPSVVDALLHHQIERPTFGQWANILKTLSDALPAVETLVLPELPEIANDRLLPALLGQGRLVYRRNLFVHGGGMSSAAAQGWLPTWEPWLRQLVVELRFLSEAEVYAASSGALVQLVGPSPEGTASARPLPAGCVCPAEHVVLVRGDRFLEIWPLCLYGRGRTTEGSKALREARSASPHVFARADDVHITYVPLGVDLPQAESASGIGVFRRLFGLDARSHSDQPRDFEQELRADSAALLGRSRELARAKGVVSASRTGSLWVEGPAGIGKSYLMARLATDFGSDARRICRIAWRFRASDGPRCSRIAFFRHAVERLGAWLARPCAAADDTEELSRQLAALLDRAAAQEARPPLARPARVLFVLDGLDEIAAFDPKFLDVPFDFARTNVVWLCAGRPEALASSVRERWTHVFPTGLPPMSDAEVRGMLIEETGKRRYELFKLDREGQPGAEVENLAVAAVAERAKGLPLFVHFVVEDIVQDHFRFEDLPHRLPPSLSEYYDDLLRRLSIGDLQALLTPLAVTLAWAHSPLAEETLQRLMRLRSVLLEGRAGRAVLLRGLAALGSLLRTVPLADGSRGYELYHPTLREHIRIDAHGRLGQQNDIARRTFCDLVQAWQTIPSEERVTRRYCFAFGARHLVEGERAGLPGDQVDPVTLWTRDEASFLRGATAECGAALMENQIRSYLHTALTGRGWLAGARALVLLRRFRAEHQPLLLAAQAIQEPLDATRVAAFEEQLGLMPDRDWQAGLLLLAAARAEDDGRGAVVQSLLGCLERLQPQLVLGGESLASVAAVALLEGGPLSLAQKLATLPVFADARARSEALAMAWFRDRDGSLRSTLLATLECALRQPWELSPEAASLTLRRALVADDWSVAELLLRWLPLAPALRIESLVVTPLLEHRRLLEAVPPMLANERVRDSEEAKAAVCAVALTGRAPSGTDLVALAGALARATAVPLDRIRAEFAHHSEFALLTFGLSPEELEDWLRVHLPLLAGTETWQGPSRLWLTKFVTELSVALRWVAAQSEARPEARAAILNSLALLTGLCANDGPLPGAPIHPDYWLERVGEMEPLSLRALWDSALWLAGEGWVSIPPLPRPLELGARRRLIELLFGGRPVAERETLLETLDRACGGPLRSQEGWRVDATVQHLRVSWGEAPSQPEDGVLSPPWHDFAAALIQHSGREWDANRTESEWLPDAMLFPLRQLRDRVLHLFLDLGCQPELVSLTAFSQSVRALRTNRELEFELEQLATAAASRLEPELAKSVSWLKGAPPALLLSRRVPRALAPTLASALQGDRARLLTDSLGELIAYGARDEEWWSSVRKFRDDLRTLLAAGGVPATRLLSLDLLIGDFAALADAPQPLAAIKTAVRVRPEHALLERAVEQTHEVPSWLLLPLVRARRWDLAVRLLSGAHAGRRPETAALRGFEVRASEPRWPGDGWQDAVEAALGIRPTVPGEPGVSALALASIDPSTGGGRTWRPPSAVHLAPDFAGLIERAWRDPEASPRRIVHTLTCAALVSGGGKSALLLADGLMRGPGPAAEFSDPERLQAEEDILWAALALASELVSSDRTERLARCGRGLELLARLGDRRGLRLHLESAAGSEKELLAWCVGCTTLPLTEQELPLSVYVSGVPELLGAHANLPRDWTEPPSSVARELALGEYKGSDLVAAAVRAGRPNLADLWFRAILVMARLGPGQGTQQLATVCRAAGAWLGGSPAGSPRTVWVNRISRWTSELDAGPGLWQSFFRGLGASLGGNLARQGRQWLPETPLDDRHALLALAEAAAPCPSVAESRQLWIDLMRRCTPAASLWAAVRAARSYLFVEREDQRRHRAGARWFTVLADRLCARRASVPPELVAAVMDLAISSRCPDVVSALIDRSRPEDRAPLARVALDVVFREIADYRGIFPDSEEVRAKQLTWDEPPWPVAALAEEPGLSRLIEVLLDDPVPDDDGRRVSAYDHPWRNERIRAGCGWLAALINAAFLAAAADGGARTDSCSTTLSWIASWVGRVPPDRDIDRTVARVLVERLRSEKVAVTVPVPILQFAAQSLMAVPGGYPDVRIGLLVGLARAGLDAASCLQVFERAAADLPAHERTYYAAEVGVARARTPDAERYLERVSDPAMRATTLDRVHAVRGTPWQTRLQALKRAPRVAAVLERTSALCVTVLRDADLQSLDDGELCLLVDSVLQLLPGRPDVDRQLADALATKLSPEQIGSLASIAG
jgi:hypothetical protein